MNMGNPIAVGNTAEIYRVEGRIVKVFKEYLPPLIHIHEAKKQEYAFSCGLPVPKVLKVTELEGRQAIMIGVCRRKNSR